MKANLCVGIMLSALIQSGEVAIPIAFEWVKKMVTYGDLKTKKVQRMGDSCWYASKENMKHIKSKGKQFVLALKSNRLIALNQKDPQRGEFNKLSELELGENTAVGAYFPSINSNISANKSGEIYQWDKVSPPVIKRHI